MALRYVPTTLESSRRPARDLELRPDRPEVFRPQKRFAAIAEASRPVKPDAGFLSKQ
jgi:hypothetical protein